MRKTLSFLLTLMMLLSLVACGGNGDQNTPNSGPSGTGAADAAGQPAAQYYNVYLVADPTTMDVSRNADSYSGTIINNVMEGLVRLGETNGEYEMKPGDAQTWELSDDGMV